MCLQTGRVLYFVKRCLFGSKYKTGSCDELLVWSSSKSDTSHKKKECVSLSVSACESKTSTGKPKGGAK